ncbi:MAG: aminotransferase class IV [Cruoricaptor ignavus]|nr:aminotransferase class IV [Cruoricaptor ignavus]
MSRFIESIKVEDQKIFLLELHQKRVNDTFSHFGKEPNLDISTIFKTLEHDEDGLYKLRIVYDLQGDYEVSIIPYVMSKIPNFELVENDEMDYSLKFEDRKILDEMKERAETSEIIIVKNGYITDTSYSNILFLKDKKWYTPNTYLLNGVQRQNLLNHKKIQETEITLENIKDFSHFQLINAMNHPDDAFVYSIEKIINLPKEELFLDF